MNGRSDGQAAPEYVGLIVIITLMLAAAALIAARGGWLGGRDGPAAVAVVSSPLAELARPRPSRGGGGLGRLRRVTISGIRLTARGVAAAARGFGGAARDDLEAFLRDPVGTIRGGGSMMRDVARDPIGTARAVIDDARAYARELRTMPSEEAFLRMMGDLGALGEDVALMRGRGLIRKQVLRRLRERMERGAGMAAGRPTQ